MALRDTLKKLFTRNIVVTHTGGGNLKVFDVSKVQSVGSFTAKNRYQLGYRAGGGTNIPGVYNSNIYDIEANRLRMYADYEVMDSDAIIGAALDIYADSTVTKDTNNQILTIHTQNDEIKKILYNLYYDILNIDFNLWAWVRELCKFGDYFLYIQTSEKYGVINVTPLHPSIIQRDETMTNNPDSEFRFKYVGMDTPFKQNQYFDQTEIAHFRLLSSTNYLPYGKSAIDAARKEYKKFSLFEDALLLQRIMRAPERRIFKVDIGNIAPEEVDAYMKKFISSMKKVPYIDPETGDYNLKFNLQTMLEDFYLPVRGDKSGTSIETLPGLGNENHIQDVEFSKGKVLAALKIPKAWLGFDESVDGKANTAGLDIRFASTIERIQKVVISELYKIGLIHLVSQGIPKDELLNFELTLANSSTIRKRQDIDLLNEKMTLTQAMLESKLFSHQYIYERVFDLSPDEWRVEKEQVLEDTKYEFRVKQITDEGNDPAVSGKSFGTPHDLAALQMSSKLEPGQIRNLYNPEQDGRTDNPGRPVEPGTFKTDHDKSFGRDPDGQKTFERGAKESYYKSLIDKWSKKVIITEQTKNEAEPSLLNENRLLTTDLPMDTVK